MLPIAPSICGALFSVASRTARGEFDLSEQAREKLERARSNVEDVSDLIGDFSPTEPGSWTRFLGRLMDHSFETEGRFDSARAARDALGFGSKVTLPTFVIGRLQRTHESTCIYEDDDEKVALLRLPNDVVVALEIPVSDHGRPETTVYRDASSTSRTDVNHGAAEAFWQGRESVLLDHQSNGPVTSPLDLSTYEYFGERLAHIDEWRAFSQAGIRRNVLLQGPPGCGKSTLCCHAARQLGDRTVMLTPECFGELNMRTWLAILDVLKPVSVIVDDIDRAQSGGRYSSEDKLRFVEEGYCDVPFLFFTSNDHTRLPPALRRPGRIDQIIRFDEPSADVRQTIVRNLSDRESVEVPAGQMPVLTTLLEDFSAAHVVEALRRARVLGWDAYGGESLGLDGDQTFLLQRDFDGQADWLTAHGFAHLDTDVDFVFDEIKRRAEREVAYEDDHDTLFRMHLPNAAQICFESDQRNRFSNDDLQYRPDIDGRDRVLDGIAQLFWQGRDAVLIDHVQDRATCTTLTPSSQPYYGVLLDCIERWKGYREHGLRRNILLQGPPGCGKSTFCRHAASELSDRTLMLTPDYFESVRCSQWQSVIDMLQPDMVIVDDVDRVGSHSLESKLRLFEEDYCDIPFVMFTTNDHEKLPKPMRRPGRIDQIIEVEPPDRSLRWQLIREMASRVGTNVPDAQLPHLETILQEQSTAHLVEALRRGKVDGWDATAVPGDITFTPADEATNDDITAFLD